VNYSIIIPVFNKAAFTKRCLDTLRATLTGAGDGEVIVVDNASTDETPQLLANYPWIRVIRNERNLGFAGANNQAARVASGKYLVLLNNDTEGFAGWLKAMIEAAEEPGVGIVGAKLLYADGSIQHGGVVVAGSQLGRFSINPVHYNHMVGANDRDASQPGDFQVVTGACMLTPRALYHELGGLDELYWNGYEDVDYCLKVKQRGLRVVYEPKAVLYHFESQSGVQRFRRSLWNMETLEARWRGAVALDASERTLRGGMIRRADREPRGSHTWHVMPIPNITVLVHGGEPAQGRDAFESAIRNNAAPVERIVWATGGDPVAAAREAMEVRGNRYFATVHGNAALEPSWLDALIGQVEAFANACASTAAPELPAGSNVRSLSADARCTLLSLRKFPQHMRLSSEFESLDGAIADLLLRALELRFGTRGLDRRVADLPAVRADAAFEAKHGMPLASVLTTDAEAIEARLRARKRKARGLVSIVTLSWNAVSFTKIALDSIRLHTSEPYEVIVVDNGSEPETIDYLRSIDDPHVRVVYNAKNLGFGGGNNVGMAEARGEYVVLLNNDVIVTDGWIEGLLAPFERIGWLGMTAPRSNQIAGDQLVTDAVYSDAEGVQRYAAERRRRWNGQGYITERAIGFCLCIDRRVIDEVGGFDPRFGLGNFEDDDLCVRVRAAGYGIYVCDDVFIHHFGSQSFRANKVDYAASMATNWSHFAKKWGYTHALDPHKGYDPRFASRGGFVRDRHYVALPSRAAGEASRGTSDVAFAAAVSDEAQWQAVATFVRRFARAFSSGDSVTLAIAASGDLTAEMVGARIERLLERVGLDPEAVANIDVSDEDDGVDWKQSLGSKRVIDVVEVGDASPAGLRRFLEERAS
jgi:GT2 family glycosyltransferase